MKQLRFRQRFSNFKNAWLRLKEAMERFDELDTLALEGLIQRFEFTFELAWKTLKDYQEAEGFITQSPRETLKQAFLSGIIENGEIWMEMLDKRNLMAHTYDETTFVEVINAIRNKYFDEIKQLFEYLSEKAGPG